MSGNMCYRWDPDGVPWTICRCPSCQARQRTKMNRQFRENKRNSKGQDSRKVHDTKGRNTQSRSNW